MNFAVQREQQCDGVLGNSVRRVGRHTHYDQAELAGGGHIHVVETGTAQGEELHPKRG